MIREYFDRKMRENMDQLKEIVSHFPMVLSADDLRKIAHAATALWLFFRLFVAAVCAASIYAAYVRFQ